MRKPAPRKTAGKSAPAPAAPPKRDRSRLNAAEAALDDHRRRAVRERAALLRERKTLEMRAEHLEAELQRDEARLAEAVERERRRFEQD